MKKILILTALLLILTMMPFTLFSCDSTEDPQPTEAPTNAPTEAPTSKPTEKPTSKPTDNNNNNDDNNNNNNNNNNDEELEYEDLEDRTYAFKDEEDLAYFKRIGRSVVVNRWLCCDNTASGIEFEGVFEGEVNLEIRVEVAESNSPVCFFTVYIDGKRVEDTYNSDGDRTEGAFVVEQGVEVVTLADFDEPGRHTIRIVKQCGPRLMLASFKELSITGYLLPAPEEKELYIEVLGDSITSGQGTAGWKATAGNVIPNADRVDFADGTKTYAYLTAEEFDADYSIISESAIALDGSWFGDGRTIFDHYNSYSLKRETARDKYAFDFENERVPDLIVINLGTNDSALTGNGKTNTTKTKAAVKELVELIRDGYGTDVPIVWINGMLDNGGATWDAIDAAFAELGGEDADLYRLKVSGGDSIGHTSHPSANAHKQAAEDLIKFIKNKGLLG